MDLAERCARSTAGLTIPALLERNATEFADLPALNQVGSAEDALTWSQLRQRVAELSRGLADAGLSPGGRMLIMMSARPEHWLVDLGAVHLGAVPCTAYATLSTHQLRYLAAHSRAQVVVLEGEEQLARWRPILDELPDLVRVVVVEEASVPAGDDRFRSLADVSARGAALHHEDPGVFEARWREIRPEHPVTLLYTSGTTGDPKGVVLSHRNVIYQAVVIDITLDLPAHAASVAYLPLAHIAERMLGIYLPVYRAGHVHVCTDPTQLVAALSQVRPVAVFGVPRMWEKTAAGLHAFLASAPEPVRAAVTAASEVALEEYRCRADGRPVPDELAARLAEVDAAVLKPIRAKLGMDNLVWSSSGAAPIPVDILLYLAGFGITVLEVWGMTETTGTVTINATDRFRTGTVGQSNPGMEVRIAADGEILVRGPLICLGYLRPDGTVEPVTDADGWLATGDIGTLDEDGFLTITDRKKELIITSGGKNISPAQIENLLRAHPLVGQAVAIGDRRPYVTALLVLDEETAPAWAKARGIEAPDLATLAGHPAVRAELDSVVEAANTKLARVEQVKRYAVVPVGWTPETGELTPTLKLRRRVVTDRYATTIDSLYA
jgi:long-chain acyl-CoA synthetase